MSLGRYTELFFLDEAVALAAGHRPCAECRGQRHNDFREAWLRSENLRESDRVFADVMDATLHPARIDRQRMKVTYPALECPLPDGCFVRIDGADWLLWEAAMFRWSPARYVEKRGTRVRFDCFGAYTGADRSLPGGRIQTRDTQFDRGVLTRTRRYRRCSWPG